MNVFNESDRYALSNCKRREKERNTKLNWNFINKSCYHWYFSTVWHMWGQNVTFGQLMCLFCIWEAPGSSLGTLSFLSYSTICATTLQVHAGTALQTRTWPLLFTSFLFNTLYRVFCIRHIKLQILLYEISWVKNGISSNICLNFNCEAVMSILMSVYGCNLIEKTNEYNIQRNFIDIKQAYLEK